MTFRFTERGDRTRIEAEAVVKKNKGNVAGVIIHFDHTHPSGSGWVRS